MNTTRIKRLAIALVLIGASTMQPAAQRVNSMETGLYLYAAPPSAFIPPFPLVDIIEISLEGKTYVPHEARAKPGDTIRICNKDPFFHAPFSFTKYNQFGNPKGVRIKPGECILSLVVQNPTKVDLCVKLNDEIHSYEKGIVAVSPESGAFSWSGSWKIVQTMPDGAKYTGTMKLDQIGTTLAGGVEWDLRPKGKLIGHIEECKYIYFTVDYGGGLFGLYDGVLRDNGIEIYDGNAGSSTGGPQLTWSASR